MADDAPLFSLSDVFGAPELGHFSVPARILRWMAPRLPEPPHVVELGTGYGTQLRHFVPLCRRVVCVDAMYGWVPDLTPGHSHDPGRVDPEKLAAWRREAGPFGARVELVVDTTLEAAEKPALAPLFSGADVLVVDGCHHPTEAVFMDYRAYFPHLALLHHAVFDDTYDSDPAGGCDRAQAWLREEGHSVEAVSVFGNKAVLLRVRKKKTSP